MQSRDSIPITQRLVLGMVVIGLVVSGFYGYVWKPIQRQTEMVRGDVQQLGQEIEHYEALTLARKAAQVRMKQLEIRLYGEHANGREDRGQGGLRNRITSIAQTYLLDMTSWQPDAMVEESPDGVKGTPIRVEIEGGYHQVANFFASVLHLPEVIGISQFSIGVTDDHTHQFDLRTHFVLTRLDPLLIGERLKVAGP